MVEVVPGVHRIPLPLPNERLQTVNVYAVEDGDGIVLIDSGQAVAEAQEALSSALAGPGRHLSDIRRFMITHAHSDHYTLVVVLRQESGGHIALGLGEKPSAEHTIAHGQDGFVAELHKWGAPALADVWNGAVQEITNAEMLHHYEMPDEWLVRSMVTVEGPVALGDPHTRSHARARGVRRPRRRSVVHWRSPTA